MTSPPLGKGLAAQHLQENKAHQILDASLSFDECTIWPVKMNLENPLSLFTYDSLGTLLSG